MKFLAMVGFLFLWCFGCFAILFIQHLFGFGADRVIKKSQWLFVINLAAIQAGLAGIVFIIWWVAKWPALT